MAKAMSKYVRSFSALPLVPHESAPVAAAVDNTSWCKIRNLSIEFALGLVEHGSL